MEKKKKQDVKIKNTLIDQLKKICKKYGYKLTELTIEEIQNA